MKQKHRTIILYGLILSFLFSMTCYAYPNAAEHDKALEEVLFEENYSKYQSSEIKKYVDAIEYASYLSIDQFGGNGTKKFNELKNWGMGGLPYKFEAIDYSEDFFGNGKKIEANTHRLYTHQGWDREYQNSKVREFWKKRREVLLGTVNSIFEFNMFPSLFGYTDECNSLCGIIYYVHILGDYDEADKIKKIALLIDLAGHSGTDDNDMITQLKKYIDVLFKDQKNTDDYKALINGINDIEDRAGKLVRSVGGVNTDDEFKSYHKCAIDLLELLKKHIPVLLKNEDFFSRVFYPKNSIDE